MAEGGDAVDAGSCYEPGGESDEYPDFVCHPCRKDDGKIIAAQTFCIDCGDLMCTKCLDQHSRFGGMRGHRLTAAEESSQHEDRASMPTIRCSKHNGRIVDMYCNLHEKPGCVNCMSIEHSACNNRDYIPKIAKGIKDYKAYDEDVKSCERKLEALKESQTGKESCLNLLEEQVETSLGSIVEKRETLDLLADSKQELIENEIRERSNKKATSLRDEIEELKDTIEKMDAKKTKLKNRELNESDTFIVMKTVNAFDSGTGNADTDMDEFLTSVKLSDTPEDWTKFEKLNLFGELSEIIEVTFDKDYSISSPKVDKRGVTACITDSCLLDDGKILLADQNQRALKKLNSAFQIEDACTLPGKPGAVCQTNYPEVAVSILSNKSVQFANVTSPMTLTRSFSIEESCRGIAFSNSLLYLSCGGMQQYNDGPGEIRVYDLSGDLCRKYSKINGKQISIPKRLTVTSTDVFFADNQGGVFGLGVGSAEKGPYTHANMIDPIGVCGLKPGVLIVCGYESHNVMVLYEKDGTMKPLIAADQGLKNPKSVIVDRTGKKLIVSTDKSKYIKVFNIMTK